MAGYAATGQYDELLGADGQIADHWWPVLAELDALTNAQRKERIERINERVRETGIAHDLFADPSRNVTPWRLDLFPLVIAPATWSRIETAVIQRARLMERLLEDIYGAQTLLDRGLIPPGLVFSDPAYLRACRGLGPDGARIQFLAVDLARGRDGSWHVFDQHLETPAGIGYALANRTVLTHVCGDIFNAARAVRLAPYFQSMQEALAARATRADPSIALLTPGPRHNDFFSHSYLARYLGLLLVEGDDLRVDDGHVYLKTLDGLQPIDLVVRCTAGAYCDPLELDQSGFLGPVGMVQAMRRQPGIVINALGTAIAENRGLGSYLPALSRDLIGEELAMLDVAKLWLGDAEARRLAAGDPDRYFIRRAFEQTARPGRAAPAIDPARLSDSDRKALFEQLEFDGACYVAEEKIPLGTTPSYGPAGLQPRTYALRVFATATPGGFTVMPGGLAMTIDPGTAVGLVSPECESRDVWVLSDAPQPPFKSLWRPTMDAAQIQRGPREMPSRAADNLFWLGRYVEQADWTFRVLRNCLARIEEDSGPRQSLKLARVALTNLLRRGDSSPPPMPAGLDEARTIAHLARLLLTAPDVAHGVPQTLAHIHRIASLSRDRLSLEAWRILNAFYAGQRWQQVAMPSSIGEELDLIDAGLGVIASFNGLSHENMTRNHGWSFLDMGRRMSRAMNLSELLTSAFVQTESDENDDGRLLLVLELADSFITYRSRYRYTPTLPLVLDLLIIDETNPRSLAFQFAALASEIDSLPQTGKGRGRTEEQRMALALLSEAQLADVQALAEADKSGRRSTLAALLGSLSERMPRLTDAISRRYFSVTEKAPRWVRAQSGR